MIFDTSQNGGADERHAFLSALLYQDWEQPGGVIEFNEELTLDAVEGATHFQNVRTILRALVENEGTPATATGCFNRAFAGRMLEEMRIPSLNRESIQRICKVINESDVPDLIPPLKDKRTLGEARKTPMAFRPPAQGWREERGPTLGKPRNASRTLKGFHPA